MDWRIVGRKFRFLSKLPLLLPELAHEFSLLALHMSDKRERDIDDVDSGFCVDRLLGT